MSTSDPMQLIGKVINKHYRFDKLLGNGAVANVFLGTDLQTNKVVAIKQLMDTAKQADQAQIIRFERESTAMEQLNHPNIVNVYDTIFVVGDHFIVMEYVDGGSLSDLLQQRKQLDVKYALKVGKDIATAMILVHDADIIHRDIKPDNILLTREGTAKLTDFGMARFTYMSRLTQKDMMVGSMMYMSPEQFKTGEAAKSSDIWAFGIMVYEMLAGRKPFDKPHHIVTQPHIPLIEARPDVPPKISEFADHLLHKDPKIRLRSFEDICDELETLMQIV